MTLPVEGAQGGAGTEGQGTQTGTTDGAPGTQGQGTQDAAQNVVSRAEFDQIRAQLSAADKNRQAAEAKAKALEDAQLSEEEKRKRDLEDAQKVIAEKDSKIQELTLDMAFLSDNSHDWHNPKAALALADKSAVKVGEDGKVSGLKEALEAVAKAHPYLLKPKGEAGSETGTGQSAAPAGVTGVAGQGAGTGTGNNTRAGLEKKFPALRGRTS
jgi:hypothetical protein